MKFTQIICLRHGSKDDFGTVLGNSVCEKQATTSRNNTADCSPKLEFRGVRANVSTPAIYIYVYVCIHTYIYIYVCMYVYIYMYV